MMWEYCGTVVAAVVAAKTHMYFKNILAVLSNKIILPWMARFIYSHD